jgi:pimeloyl-ACP methyl ester carboxylesterase
MSRLPYDLDKLDIREHRIATNGIELNVFEAGDGPPIVLLHGFPECWANWGPQISHLVRRGYRVIAPEQRGYGASDAPEAVTAYDTVELAADVAGLIDATCDGRALLMGHDWGCAVAWHTAWLHPEKLAGVGGLCVPWFGRGEAPITDIMDAMFPNDYFYMREFQGAEASALFDRDHRDTLTRMMTGELKMLGQPEDGRNCLERIDIPSEHPAFMPEAFIDYLVSRYRFHGFMAPHNWYRNFRRTFERTAKNLDDVIRVPSMYLTGDREWTVELAEVLGLDETEKLADLRVQGMTEAGHWLGQERPEWVNEKIDEFLASIGY